MNSSPKDSSPDKFQYSQPIPIGRRRSASVSSSSSGSQSSPAEPQTPLSATAPRAPSSPILSYFLAQSPSKPNGSFPFRRTFGSPVFEDDEPEKELPVAAHARRASLSVSNRFGQPQPAMNLPHAHRERGTAVLRRLSLSSGNTRPPLNTERQVPSPPPNSAVSPSFPKSLPSLPPNKPKRSATLSPDTGRHRRAPSPMGERILKGHFDGFN